MKKTAFFFILFFLSFSYTEEYLLEKAQNYFNSIEWAENSMLDFSTLPTPYSVGDNGVDSTFLYADNIREDDVLPEVKDLGVLDYTRTPFPLLSSMKAFSKSIVDKKIKENLSAKGRDFLAPLFEYRLSSIKGIEKIDYAFFSSPTFEGGKKATCKFRFNYKRDAIPKYRIIEASFIKEEEKWALFSFDFIGWELDDSTK